MQGVQHMDRLGLCHFQNDIFQLDISTWIEQSLSFLPSQSLERNASPQLMTNNPLYDVKIKFTSNF